ncbi:MAG: hypothetical protein IPH88_09000 [Bacteroidales bacterium]|nr:hypothetical protein [Bacteroidales bacterium]
MKEYKTQVFCILLTAIFLFAGLYSFAQENSVSKLDSLSFNVARLNKTVDVLEKIKISGYIQAQFQIADTLGVKSFNGGDFTSISSKRFQVRRGYFKVAYAGKLSTYVLQINANEKGFNIRDAYFSLKDPWLKAFSLTGGIFYRPFGYELSYSTSQRESPELSRMYQLLFPGERDLGASLTFQMPESSPLHPVKFEAGLFSGNGTSSETDDKLDFIGRIGYSDSQLKGKISYVLGVSYYDGYIYQAKKEVYNLTNVEGITVFRQLMADTIPGKYYKRQYFGIDGQFSISTPLGTTSVRADYISGKQPGSDKSSISPTAAIDYPLYLRSFNGGVVYLVHSIPKTIHTFLLKYDTYDPNTSLKGDEIGKSATASIASNGTDVAFTTWGFGYIADFNKNLRVSLYYDLVKNEKSINLKNYHSDQKDNVFTVRVQYKF